MNYIFTVMNSDMLDTINNFNTKLNPVTHQFPDTIVSVEVNISI